MTKRHAESVTSNDVLAFVAGAVEYFLAQPENYESWERREEPSIDAQIGLNGAFTLSHTGLCVVVGDDAFEVSVRRKRRASGEA